MSDTRVDVIVLGAGPAGAAAAVTAARAGLSVALIDKARFPRDKLCGGLFSGRSLLVYQAVFDSRSTPLDMLCCTDVTFFQGRADLGEVSGAPPIYLTMRRDLDTVLMSQAVRAGARDLTGERVAEVDVTAPAVRLHSGLRVTGRALIGADGVNSQVARALFGASYDRRKIGFAMEIEAPVPSGDPHRPIRIDFGAAAWGYGWSFPKKASTTIGIGGPQRLTPDFKAALHDYLSHLGEAGQGIKARGHHIPCGDFPVTPGRGATLLAGDAAGLVDPVTGEGIAYAMQSGQAAAHSVAAALNAGDPTRALPLYRDRISDIHRDLRIARRIKPMIFAPWLQPSFARSFTRSRTLKHMYLQVLAGECDYPTLSRAVLRRLPRVALSVLRPGRP